MNTFIALFRGINVGGKNILPMQDLKQILVAMGCENVSTYIQSGNAVFQVTNKPKDSIAIQIRSRIFEHYGFKPQVLLLDKSDLQNAIENNPFRTDSGKALHFFFLRSLPQKPDIDRLLAVKSKSEEFKLINNIFYLYVPDGIGRSKLAPKVEQSMGVPVTARSWNTVHKLINILEIMT